MTRYEKNKLIDFLLTIVSIEVAAGFGLHLLLRWQKASEPFYNCTMGIYCIVAFSSLIYCTAHVISTIKNDKR